MTETFKINPKIEAVKYDDGSIEYTVTVNQKGVAGGVFLVSPEGDVSIMDTNGKAYEFVPGSEEDFEMPSTKDDDGGNKRGFLNDTRLHLVNKGIEKHFMVQENIKITATDYGDGDISYSLIYRNPKTGLDKQYRVSPKSERADLFIQKPLTADVKGPDTVLHQNFKPAVPGQ